jgi:hypothetical protein
MGSDCGPMFKKVVDEILKAHKTVIITFSAGHSFIMTSKLQGK